MPNSTEVVYTVRHLIFVDLKAVRLTRYEKEKTYVVTNQVGRDPHVMAESYNETTATLTISGIPPGAQAEPLGLPDSSWDFRHVESVVIKNALFMGFCEQFFENLLVKRITLDVQSGASVAWLDDMFSKTPTLLSQHDIIIYAKVAARCKIAQEVLEMIARFEFTDKDADISDKIGRDDLYREALSKW